ncbi:protein rep, partial [Vibrio splendidus]
MVEKRKPSNDSALAGDSFKGSDSAEKLPDRISRYGKAKSRAMENCNWLAEYSKSLEGICSVKDSDEIKPMDSAERSQVDKLRMTVESCSNWMVFHHYYTVDKIRLARGSFCKKHLMCPLCAIRRGAKSLKAYLDRYELILAENAHLKPYFLTLTVANGDDLKERIDHLTKSFKKYMTRKRVADT